MFQTSNLTLKQKQKTYTPLLFLPSNNLLIIYDFFSNWFSPLKIQEHIEGII